MARGRTIVFGGETSGTAYLNDTWKYAGNAYGVTLAGAGGTPPYAFTIASGVLPPGIVFQPPATFSGTPTATGNYRFQMTVSDAQGRSCPKAFALRVRPSGPSG